MSAIPDVDDTDSGADADDEDATAGVGKPLPASNGSTMTIFLKYCIGFS
jgi:hypothetical protein